MIRIYFGGNFSGFGPLNNSWGLCTVSLQIIRNMKQLVGSLFSVSVAFSVSTQEPIGKGCYNNFARLKVNAVAKSPKVSGGLN